MDNTSGASNANDFQPPTRNPQSSTPGLQNTQQGLQSVIGGSQSQLNSSQPLVVETAQSGTTGNSSVQTVPAQPTAGAGLLLFVVVVLIASLLYKRWNLFAANSSPRESSDTNDGSNVEAVATENTSVKLETPVDKPASKPKPKAKSKKSKSKGKKKARR